MKTPSCFLPFAAAVLWLPALSLAQTVTSGLPGFISYQGRVLNSAGTLVGAGTPVNRTVTFRIWDHPSNTQVANLIYSETQMVTISEGEFSVLVGQGVPTTATQFGYSEILKGPSATFSVASAFNGAGRYLAVTVDDGSPAVDNEISPRQQVVSSAYAFRAKFAETLGTSTSTALTALDSGNVGVGTSTPPARFTIQGINTGTTSSSPQLLITDSGDTNERLRIGVDSTGNGSGFLQAFKEGLGAQNLLLNPNGGFVGIGKTVPVTALDVNGVIRANGTVGAPAVGENGGLGQRLVLWPGTATSVPYGIGVDNNTYWNAAPTGVSYKWYEGISEKMRLSGNALAIGTASTSGRLNVGEDVGSIAGIGSGTIVLDHENNGGASSIVFRSKVNRGSDFGYLQYQDASVLNGTGEAAVMILGTANDPDDHIALLPAGNVGVGTTAPTYARLHVVGGPYQGIGGGVMNGTFFPTFNGGLSAAGISSVGGTVSIYGNGNIWSGSAMVASSDERIKNIKGHSDSAADLQTLLRIEVTDYVYKDEATKGNIPQKKVVAQQVEKFFPQAVSKQTEVVPDIFKPGTIKGGWTTLTTNLKKGERVRLVGDAQDGVYEVLETREGAFRTTFDPPVQVVAGVSNQTAAGVRVFVYGREVNDFRTVDYDALAMLNVSATQQLKKEADLKVKALAEENDLLKTRLRDLETKEAARTARLAELETRDKSLLDRMQAVESLLQSSKASK